MAVANYRSANNNLYPPAFVLGPDGRPWHGWRILILPYIEQDALFKRYRFDEPWDGPNNRELADQIPDTFTFPGRRREGSQVANYLAVVGKETLWPGATPHTGEHPDGASSTILLVENDGLKIPWMEPRDLSFDEMSFALPSPHGISSPYQGAGVVTADGSLLSLGDGMSAAALRALLTANGGERVAMDDGEWRVMEDGRDRALREQPGPP